MGKRQTMLAAAFALLFLGCGFYYLYGYHWEERSRQRMETELAGQYLDRLLDREWREEQEEYPEYWMQEDWEEEEASSWITRQRDVWYLEDGLDLTPDYGDGVMQCVLEVPSAGILRGVYVGDWEEISHDIALWMITAARPDYIPGKTHICIYGCSQPGTGLAFSGLSDAQIGDSFFLTCETGRYEYRVTNIFAASRETAAEVYVDNFYLPKEMCYLITSGSGENRNQHILVEGTMQRYLTVREWQEESGSAEHNGSCLTGG